jgi:plasmid maintenance system antidote protein VapI
MLTTAKLLEAAKKANNLPSNGALARILGVPDQTVYRWNTGKNQPDDINAIRLAALAGLDPGEVLAALQAESAKDTETRKVWESVAKRSRAAVAAFLAVILSAFTGIGPDGGALASPMKTAQVQHVSECDRLCIMSTGLRALLQRSKAWLDTITWAIFGPLTLQLRTA